LAEDFKSFEEIYKKKEMKKEEFLYYLNNLN
jgi:hypothetical protein